MQEKPIIEVRGIKKRYRLGVINSGTLANDLKSWWARKTNKNDPNRKVTSEKFGADSFWALKGVTFQVNRCESVGIIGQNGAGKSTLLKILSRVTTPTEGEAVIRGRITSMLEIGTGFNTELTGRENVYLNGAILGMSKKEIDSKMEQIIDFSECREFIDTPVKRYSSGMFVKLAFSVAAHLDSEIMIMDEVLAVGDVQFQKKCIAKMIDSITNEKKTVLYVSHNMETIREFCSRCIVLNEGQIIFDGDPEEAIAIYSGQRREKYLSKSFEESKDNGYGVYVRKVELQGRNNTEFIAGEQINLKLEWGTSSADGDIVLGAMILKGSNTLMTSFSKPFSVEKNETYVSDLEIDTSMLEIGNYSINLCFCRYTTPTIESFYSRKELFSFSINDNKNQLGIHWHDDVWGETVGKNMTVTLNKAPSSLD